MAWREYKYDEVMEEGAGALMNLGKPPEPRGEPNDAAVARAHAHATYALACLALARELREADQVR
jgi:hypothetical protein